MWFRRLKNNKSVEWLQLCDPMPLLEAGACLTENKAELYQWLDPTVTHQTKPDELVRLKVAEYAIQERVVAQHTERACGTQQVRRDSGACGMRQPGCVGTWDATGGACRTQRAGVWDITGEV